MTGAVLERAEDAAQSKLAKRVGWLWRYYTLFILMLVLTVSIFDRYVMTILVEPIRHDLSLSDTQIGFLTGFAFVLVYAFLCIPAARLADVWSRINIIAIAVSVWSVMTMLCGLARSPIQLFCARFGVGFGEAGGLAPSQALISDIFPRFERATAMSILLLASPLGLGGGLALGGLALHEFGWRTTFLLAGLPGLILAPLVFFTMPRVPRGIVDGAPTTKPAPLFATLRHLLSIRAFMFAVIASTAQSALSMGVSNWLPAFMARSHGMDHAAIGAVLGGALGLGSLIGHLAGGPLLDVLGKRDLRWHFRIPAICAPISGVCAAIAFIAPLPIALPLLSVQVLLAGLFAGPMYAIIANLTPFGSRAVAAAIFGFIVNVFGLGLGPQIIGILSDAFRPHFGDESLRAALLCATAIVLPAMAFYMLAGRFYRADIAAAESERAANV